MTLDSVASIFERYELAEFIEENFELYHTEGDEAVFSDLVQILNKAGVFCDDTLGK